MKKTTLYLMIMLLSLGAFTTVNASEKDFIVANLDSIVIKPWPEKYNPIEVTASNTIFFNNQIYFTKFRQSHLILLLLLHW